MGDDQSQQQYQSNGGDSRAPSEPAMKRRRITKACDFCHRRGRKCKPGPEGSGVTNTPGGHPSCLTCIEHGATCTWDRIAAKRGVKSKTSPASIKHTQSGDELDKWYYDETRHGSRNLVLSLIGIFFDTVYPVFPFYDDEILFKEWETNSMSSNRAAFARLMAICALSGAHVRDGALFNPDVPAAAAVGDELQHAYLEDARRAIPEDNREIPKHEVFEYLQVLGTMALAAIQIREDTLYEQYLGRYHNLMAQDKFHSEAEWPKHLSWKESYVRRQFFWSMYRLEVHAALISGHVVRCPELQCAVPYPEQNNSLAAILDPKNPDMPLPRKAESPFHGSWLTGWNYITDLYRVLEHVVVRMRKERVKQVHKGAINIDRLLPPIDAMLQEVLDTKKQLPLYARQAFPSSSDREANLCGFQVANIACTYQLLRMAAFACGDQKLKEACSAALELIKEISQVPVEYLRAIGHPMLQELVGVGHLLSSFITRHLEPYQYHHLREVMHAMATFLQSLGHALPNAPQVSKRLLHYITMIDRYSQLPPVMPPAMPPELPPPMTPEDVSPIVTAALDVMNMPPPVISDPYGFPNTALHNLPMNFMNNVFSNAFGEGQEIDWVQLCNPEPWTT